MSVFLWYRSWLLFLLRIRNYDQRFRLCLYLFLTLTDDGKHRKEDQKLLLNSPYSLQSSWSKQQDSFYAAGFSVLVSVPDRTHWAVIVMVLRCFHVIGRQEKQSWNNFIASSVGLEQQRWLQMEGGEYPSGGVGSVGPFERWCVVQMWASCSDVVGVLFSVWLLRCC